MRNASKDLKDWRERRALSQPQAALLLRTPVQTLRNWEQGRTDPPPVLWAAIDAMTESIKLADQLDEAHDELFALRRMQDD